MRTFLARGSHRGALRAFDQPADRPYASLGVCWILSALVGLQCLFDSIFEQTVSEHRAGMIDQDQVRFAECRP